MSASRGTRRAAAATANTAAAAAGVGSRRQFRRGAQALLLLVTGASRRPQCFASTHAGVGSLGEETFRAWESFHGPSGRTIKRPVVYEWAATGCNSVQSSSIAHHTTHPTCP